ncbi:MAG TPA: hypothetical protein VNI01_05515 [Elusimicrobiota bacterium]|nr:hypothetical protein [Elusimicrobiota bacterium]
MVIRRDWFKRQVSILAQALGAALGLRKKGDVEASLQAFENALHEAFGMNGKLALALPLESFLSLACRGEAPDPELLSSLAELFREWGDALAERGLAADAAAARSRAQELLKRASA